MNGVSKIVGGMLLVGGSCLGAGMLALPVLTGLAGFFPSLVVFLAAWAFMTITGLLLCEVNASFEKDANIISMASKTLGKVGKVVSALLYLFLFYALLVAYISGSGSVGSTYLFVLFGLSVPEWASSLVFVLCFGGIVFLGTRAVDHWNRYLMAGKIAAFLAMTCLAIPHLNPSLLLYTNPSAMLKSLPILIIAFGYHNMIPTLTTYLEGDMKKVRLTILGGSIFALVIYLIWEGVVLGLVPLEGVWGLTVSAQEGRTASDAVAGLLGLSWVSSCAEALAFFALLTSFLAQTLGLVHFLRDALKERLKNQKHENLGLCLLALIPPLACSLLYPQLFLKALSFAGGFCAVILFGFLPAMMAWRLRYRSEGQEASGWVFGGGKGLLVGVMAFSLFVLLLQVI